MSFRRALKHLAEASVLAAACSFFRLLPFPAASALGGAVARLVGPRLAAHGVALENIKAAFPELAEEDVRRVATGMWDNLGRTAAEFPNMAKFDFHRYVEISGGDILRNAGTDGKGGFFFSGHFANWEILPRTAFALDVPIAVVYRRMNNPFADRIVKRIRLSYSAAAIPKGKEGARALVETVRAGKCIGVLNDQKMNDGIAVPFFGRDAMTAPGVARLALKYDFPLIPIRVVRTSGCRFRCEISPPLEPSATGEPPQDEFALVARINRLFETWIRERPEQWFWVHRRWPKT